MFTTRSTIGGHDCEKGDGKGVFCVSTLELLHFAVTSTSPIPLAVAPEQRKLRREAAAAAAETEASQLHIAVATHHE